jgi:hypothetical protein
MIVRKCFRRESSSRGLRRPLPDSTATRSGASQLANAPSVALVIGRRLVVQVCCRLMKCRLRVLALVAFDFRNEVGELSAAV